MGNVDTHVAADFEQDIDAGKIVTAEEDNPARTIPVTCTHGLIKKVPTNRWQLYDLCGAEPPDTLPPLASPAVSRPPLVT